MRTIYLTLVAIILVMFLMSAGGCSTGNGSASPILGNEAPDFTVTDLNGQVVSLSDLRGEYVLLNFWATWCPPCVGEMPALQQVYEERAGTDVRVIALNSGEGSLTVKQFLGANDLDLVVWLDTDKNVSRKYGISGIPTTLFIDKDGIILEKVVGAFPDKESIDRYIEEHFDS